MHLHTHSAVADLCGREEGTLPSPQGFDPLLTRRITPFFFLLFSDIHFWLTDPKNFLNALLALIFTNFEGRARAKLRDFLVNLFQKVSQNAFFWPVFFSNFCLRRRTCGQIWPF